MEFRQRIRLVPMLSFIMALVFLSGMGAVVYQNKEVEKRVSSLYSVYVPAANSITAMRLNLVHLQGHLQEIATGDATVEATKPFLYDIENNLIVIFNALPHSGANIPLVDLFENYYSLSLELARAMSKGMSAQHVADAAQVASMRAKIDNELTEAEKFLKSAYRAEVEQAQERLETITVFVVGSVFAFIVLVGGTIYWFSRGLNERVSRLVEFASRVAHGDYDSTLTFEWHDEFSVVASAFNAMTKSVRETNAKLTELAMNDSLTGLLNRSAFLARLDSELRAARRHRYSLSLAICDIDRFKQINDEHGHLVGDRVIKAFADQLRYTVRAEDIVARYGGDEFCVVLPHSNAENAVDALERARNGFESINFIDDAGNVFTTTASFGVSCYLPGMDESTLMRSADVALYQAKQRGRNQVVLSSSDCTINDETNTSGEI